MVECCVIWQDIFTSMKGEKKKLTSNNSQPYHTSFFVVNNSLYDKNNTKGQLFISPLSVKCTHFDQLSFHQLKLSSCPTCAEW